MTLGKIESFQEPRNPRKAGNEAIKCWHPPNGRRMEIYLGYTLTEEHSKLGANDYNPKMLQFGDAKSKRVCMYILSHPLSVP